LTRIGHIFDESSGWAQRVAAEQLLDRLPSDQFQQHLVAVDRTAISEIGSLGRSAVLIPRRLGLSALAAPRLRTFLSRQRVDIVHAWGASAAVAARAACRKPIVVSLFDPLAAHRDVKILRTLAQSGPCAVVASCQVVRRRLIEGGLEPDRSVLVRPGIDFAKINQFHRGGQRTRLGVSRDARLVCLSPPVTRVGRHFDAALAVNVLNHVDCRHRVVIAGASRERDRIIRFHEHLPTENALIPVGTAVPVEELIAVSDVLVVAARSDVDTTAIAWAMASNTAIVAAAGYAVAELVANKVNGLLFKQTPGRSMTASIAQRLRDRASLEKATEVARGQAYEAFGLRRFVDDHARLYANMLAGVLPGEGILDAAGVA